MTLSDEKDAAEVLMDIDHWKGSFETAQWYANQLETVINNVCARLCVDPSELISGSAMGMIPDHRTLS